MTRLQLASDLHLERLTRFPGERLVKPAPGADRLILAGDIAGGAAAVDAFRDWPVPVLLVAGNHEPFDSSIEQTHHDLRKACQGTSVRFMQNEVLELDDVRLLVATLWTDFKLPAYSQLAWMREVGRGVPDYKRIKTQAGMLTPSDTLAEHEQSRRWLERELAKPAGGKKVVVVTHHAPSPASLHPSHAGSRINAAYASDLTPLLLKADLHLHGHVHHSCDYRVGSCRIIANPAGYVLNISSAESPSEFRLENPEFDPHLVIDTNFLERL